MKNEIVALISGDQSRSNIYSIANENRCKLMWASMNIQLDGQHNKTNNLGTNEEKSEKDHGKNKRRIT